MKKGFRTFRIVGIAKEEGILGYFVLSQNISGNIDSHKRMGMRVYLNGLNGEVKYRGSKDKYYALDQGSFFIKQDLMQEIGAAAFKLFDMVQKHDGVLMEQLYSNALRQQEATLVGSAQGVVLQDQTGLKSKKDSKFFSMLRKTSKFFNKCVVDPSAENTNSKGRVMDNSLRV